MCYIRGMTAPTSPPDDGATAADGGTSEATGSVDPAATEPAASRHLGRGRFGSWVRMVLRPQLNFGGALVGTVFLWLSLTPSLLPRTWPTQGIVSGLGFISGYGIGAAVSAMVHAWSTFDPSPELERRAWRALWAVGAIGTLVFLWRSRVWQDELRELVGLEPDSAWTRVQVILVAAVVAALVLVIARIVRSATRFLIRQVDRVAPRAVSVTVGVVVIVVLIVGFAQGVLWRALVSGMESAFSTVDASTADGAEQPTSTLRSGGPGSLVEWDQLGRQGRNFTGRGPDVEQLEQVGGTGCCVEPIRVYVGLESADSPESRAQLAVEELDRTGAFDREVLVVYTATGTGYINPYASSSIEYLHGGDTALVAMQYSYLPSWLTVLLDEEPPGEATRALRSAVRARLDLIPADERPQVYAFGESLGSFGVENGFETVEALQAGTDGTLLIGATFDNPLRQELTRNRQQGSPEWQPVPDVADVFFAQRPVDLPAPPEARDPSRVVYLLNASDPVTWWNWGLLVARPDWAGRPFATDRSPSFRWVPIVTFWQVVGDLPGAGNVPGGHGHIFGTNVLDGWLAVAPPSEIPDEATLQQIRELLDEEYEG